MRTSVTVTLAAVLAVLAQSSAIGSIVSITTMSPGLTLDTMTVDRDGANYTYGASELTGVTLTAFAGEGNDSSVVLDAPASPRGSAPPAAGTRAALIEDNRLDTGVVNVGKGALAATVQFASGVVNSVGDDIIFVELAGGTADSFVVTINATSKTYANSDFSGNLVPGDGNVATDLYRFVQPGTTTEVAVTSIADLEQPDSGTVELAYQQAVDNQGVRGIGINLDDFGIGAGGSISEMSYSTAGSSPSLGDPMFIAGLPEVTGPPPPAGLTDASTSVVGNKEVLDSVTVDRGLGPEVIDASALVPIDVIHFNGASDSVLATGPNDGAPAANSRAALLDGDMALNTGLINPGLAAGGGSNPLTNDPTLHRLGDGTGAPDGSEGIGFEFTRPVLNGPGIDLVLFELDDGGSLQTGDAFWLSPIDFDEYGLSLTAARYVGGDYDLFEPLEGFDLLAVNSDNIDLVETGGVSVDGLRTGFDWHAIGIDLSDLGYHEGLRVSGLFIQSGDSDQVLDPVLIVGLPDAVIPEPCACLIWSLLAGLGVGVGWSRRRW